MADFGRIDRLRQAVVNYINNDVQDGEYLGMVVFNDDADIKSPLVEMNDAQRASMLLLVPSPGDVGGATSIGAGILKGVDVLEDNGQNPAGGILLVITDGEENRSPFIADVHPTVLPKLITIDTIAIENEASVSLESLSSTSDGMSFFYTEGSNALNEAFATSAQRDQEISSLPITLYSNSLTVHSSDNLVFYIDSTIGDKTKIVVDYIDNFNTPIELTLELPDGSFITKNSPAYTLDSTFKIVTIQIPGLAQVGKYNLVINNPSWSSNEVTVTVQSRSSAADEYPIMAVSEWSVQSTSPPQAAILNVAVTRGFTPVIGAVVVATIERPAGGPLTYTLRDNGAGADVTKEDGIYSMYFTDFVAIGRYSAKVKVENDGESTVVSPSKITGFGPAIDPNVDSGDEDDTVPEDVSTGSFQRIATGGSLTCEGSACTYAAYRDFYPPARIDDLSVLRKDSDKGHVTFQFTAPGDDLDQGNATSYEFRVYQNFTTMLRELNKTDIVDRGMVIEGDLLAPKPAGQTEQFTIEIKAKTDSTVYVFSLAATDDYGNTSPQSNIVTVSLDPNSGIPVVAIVIIVLVVFAIMTVSCVIVYLKCKNNPQVAAGTVVA
ncbi:calcium-activated chloride channel regulator 2-like [Ptychodera flava]|uniref:calcium-activated chloride channel regulator 2-like n=1 Tax=Ptychodera flava TaxID=63121 RepID=UPI00396A16C9